MSRIVTPKRIAANDDPAADWSPETWALWQENVAPRFKLGEWCSVANYFTPRPYQDQYNPGSTREGFIYVVQPGSKVCFWDRNSL